jgi:hypothetical protein
MAGLAATRLFAAGGAGGVAVTAWALRRLGMEGREVAQRMIAFLVLLYGVYMLALLICGVGLYTGVFAGPHPFAITIGPAIVGAVGLVVIFAIALVPEDLERRLGRIDDRRHRSIGKNWSLGDWSTRWVSWLATVPASTSGGVRFAFHKLRHPDWAMIGVLSGGSSVAVLYASFEPSEARPGGARAGLRGDACRPTTPQGTGGSTAA